MANKINGEFIKNTLTHPITREELATYWDVVAASKKENSSVVAQEGGELTTNTLLAETSPEMAENISEKDDKDIEEDKSPKKEEEDE